MASGWNPEAAYTSPGKPGLLWVCPSAGALGILYNVLPFCGEEQAHGAQLGLLGSQRGFKHGDYGLHLGQHNGAQGCYFLGIYFFCTWDVQLGPLSPRRLGLRQGRTQLDLGEHLSASSHLRL